MSRVTLAASRARIAFGSPARGADLVHADLDVPTGLVGRGGREVGWSRSSDAADREARDSGHAAGATPSLYVDEPEARVVVASGPRGPCVASNGAAKLFYAQGR